MSESSPELRQPNDALRRAREERGWTRSDAAFAIGCSIEAIEHWENGRRRRPQAKWRVRLCEVYQRSPEELGLTRTPLRKAPSRALPEAPVPSVRVALPAPEDIYVRMDEQERPSEPPALPGPPISPEQKEKPSFIAEQTTTPAEAGFTRHTAAFSSAKGEKSRRALLARVRKTWGEEEYHRLVKHGNLLTCDLAECPQALAHPRFRLDQNVGSEPRLLPAGTSLSQVYHRTGEVLVLGERGAGKTTLLLELLRELLLQAEQQADAPIPVVFPLASWSGKHASLAEWLGEVLNKDYFLARQVAQLWVETDRLIVLLDGLDTVPEALRPGCIRAIDAYQNAHPEVPLVVCSQTEAYFAQPIRLRLSQAIQVQPLTKVQIHQYLDGACTEPQLREALHEDQALLEMCANPFVLSLLVELANQGEIRTAFAFTGSLEERRQQLLEVFLRRRHDPRMVFPYSPSQTLRSLSWLARQMSVHHQAAFYLERMQPTWLPDRQAQQQYRLTVNRLMTGITAFVFSGLLACFRENFGLPGRGLFFWLGAGGSDRLLGWMAPGIGGGMSGAISLSLLFALVTILVNCLGDRKRSLTITAKDVRDACWIGLRWSLLSASVIGVLSSLVFSQEEGFTCMGGAVSGLACGGSLGLFGGILIGFQVSFLALLKHRHRLLASEGKKQRRSFSLKARVLNGLLSGICGFLGFAIIYAWQAGGVTSLGIGYGLIAGVYFAALYHQGLEAGGGPEVGVTIQLAETVVWSWQAVRAHWQENLKKGVSLAGILFGCVVTMITCMSSLFYGLAYGVRYGLAFGTLAAGISGVTGWIMGVLTSGWSNEMLDERAFARTNEGIRRARRNALFATCLFGPIGGLTSGLTSALAFALGGVAGWPVLGAGLALIFTLTCSYQIFMLYGGMALLEHYTLRWRLWRDGWLPWNGVAFCNHAVERAFLKRWGRGYMFLHSLLEEHFAEHEIP
jgi:transcriptional regulator with XRE-family HTH domain